MNPPHPKLEICCAISQRLKNKKEMHVCHNAAKVMIGSYGFCNDHLGVLVSDDSIPIRDFHPDTGLPCRRTLSLNKPIPGLKRIPDVKRSTREFQRAEHRANAAPPGPMSGADLRNARRRFKRAQEQGLDIPFGGYIYPGCSDEPLPPKPLGIRYMRAMKTIDSPVSERYSDDLDTIVASTTFVEDDMENALLQSYER